MPFTDLKINLHLFMLQLMHNNRLIWFYLDDDFQNRTVGERVAEKKPYQPWCSMVGTNVFPTNCNRMIRKRDIVHTINILLKEI